MNMNIILLIFFSFIVPPKTQMNSSSLLALRLTIKRSYDLPNGAYIYCDLLALYSAVSMNYRLLVTGSE